VLAAPSRRSLLAGFLGLLAVAAAVFGAQALGSTLSRAMDDLGGASRGWLWIAAGCFALAVFCLAGAWRAALRLCDGEIGFGDSYARYGVGCLVSSLFPGGLGGATRLALYSRTLPGEDRVWRATGTAVLVSVAKTTGVGLLFVYAAATGAVPLWSVGIVAGVAAATAAVCVFARGHRFRGHAAHVLDAFRTLGTSPRHGIALLGFALLNTVARVGAAAAIAAAFGVGSPLAAALIIIPALAVASAIPLTPGNVGLASGAVMVALHARGIDGSSALAAGIALNGVETAVGISLGVFGLTHLAWQDARKRTMLVLGSSGAAAVACAVGATFIL
jgi:uncharacterized membrane protein YbhN (UPF0104 family)